MAGPLMRGHGMQRLSRPRAVAAVIGACAAATLALGPGAPAAAAPRAEPAHIAMQPPSLPGSPVCGPSKASPDEPPNGRNDTNRIPAPIYFAHDFPLFHDSDPASELGVVGGFGGIRLRAPLHHTPVIFVHGNQADAQNWLDVMSQFAAGAGYTMQEMYALSYNGLANYYAGAPEQLAPTALDTAYVGQNSSTLANGGHGSANDDNVPDLCRFVEAVQWYTGSRQVDLVGHSLGVTIIRRMMELYPSLARDVVAFVGVAGANHGTSVCTGQASTYYGCDEIAPGTPWLAQLNAYGETYAPTHWMTVYNGAEGDPFFIGPDVDSPHLAGADNRTFNTDGIHGDYHNDLRVDPPEVETYLSFLLRQGQAGPGAARGVEAQAQRLAADAAQREQSNQTVPSLYRLTVAPLCIPDLTGSEDGCALTVVSTFSAGEEIPAPGRGHRTAASSSGLPDTAATAPAPASPSLLASLALLGIASSAAATRRRRRSRS